MTAKTKTTALPKGIRLHRSGKFLVDKTTNGTRITKTFDSLHEAVLFRVQLESGTPQAQAQASVWTLKQAYDYAHDTVWKGKASAITNVHNGNAALKYFGEDRKLDTITLRDLDDYVNYLLDRGDTSSTVNRKLSCLSVMMKTALSRDGLPQEAMPRRFPRMKQAEHRIRFVSPDEERELVQLMRMCGYEAQAEACLVLLYTGFRLGELWKLEKRDVDLDQKILTLWETKNGHARSVPLLDVIEPIVRRRLVESEGSKIFPEGSNEWFRNAWERVRQMMDLVDDPQFVPHCLRHTCATRLSQQGIGLPVIKEWLGHQSIQTTIRYAHFNRRDLVAAAEALASTSTH
jgi:integrase